MSDDDLVGELFVECFCYLSKSSIYFVVVFYDVVLCITLSVVQRSDFRDYLLPRFRLSINSRVSQ